MAISAGRETNVVSGERVLLTGVLPLKVLAVNPNKKELEKLYGRELEKEPEYISEDEKKVKKIRIDFYCEVFRDKSIGSDIPETLPIQKVTFFLEDRPKVGSESGKYEVINIYGETTWATIDDIKAGKLPENMAFYDIKKMRPSFVGEAELVMFLKNYLGVPNKGYQDKLIPNLADAEIQLDEIKKYFSGNIKEITSVVEMRKNTNIVKLCAGVKTSDDNKQYQVYYLNKPLKYGVRDYQYLAKSLKERRNMLNVEFGPDDFVVRLYSNKPTELAPLPIGQMPMPDDDPFFAGAQENNSTSDDDWFSR